MYSVSSNRKPGPTRDELLGPTQIWRLPTSAFKSVSLTCPKPAALGSSYLASIIAVCLWLCDCDVSHQLQTFLGVHLPRFKPAGAALPSAWIAARRTLTFTGVAVRAVGLWRRWSKPSEQAKKCRGHLFCRKINFQEISNRTYWTDP